MAFINIGESGIQRASLCLPPMAAVAHATRDKDYFEFFRAPSDRSVRVKKVSFIPNATLSAAGTDYITMSVCRIKSTTITTTGTSITSNTGGGWTALTEQEMVKDSPTNLILGPGDRLAIEFDNVGAGKATTGLAFHAELEILN